MELLANKNIYLAKKEMRVLERINSNIISVQYTADEFYVKSDFIKPDIH